MIMSKKKKSDSHKIDEKTVRNRVTMWLYAEGKKIILTLTDEKLIKVVIKKLIYFNNGS